MRWYKGSISDAVLQAKQKQWIFLVFISGNDEQSKQMDETLQDSVVSSRLEDNCMALHLEANSDSVKQFSQIYPVVVLPSLYFIGLNGVPLEVIGGHLDVIHLLEKIDKVVELHEKQKQTSGQAPAAPTSNTSTNVASAASKSSTESVAEKPAPSTSAVQNLATATETESSSAPLEERVERAKQLAAEIRRQKQLEYEEKQKSDEIERRKLGKSMQKQKEKQQEMEFRQVADEIAKERAEEKAARQKIRDEIARDRAERATKYNVEKAEEERRRKEALQAKLQADQEKAATEAANRSRYARLQFRFPDGSFSNHQFEADAPLGDIYNFVKDTLKPPFGKFSLSLSFPRREFTTNDYSQSLRDLQLAPSASILVLPMHGAVVRSSSSSGGAAGLVWMLLTPFLTVWRMLQLFLFGGASSSPATAASSPGSGSSSNRGSSSAQSSRTGTQRENPSNKSSSGGNFGRREGNIFRLPNQDGPDDENNTWNGNSTQQM